MGIIIFFGVVGLAAAVIGVAFGVLSLVEAVDRLALQRERQAGQSLEAQRAVAAELGTLRRMLDGSDPQSGKVTIYIGGRVVASPRP